MPRRLSATYRYRIAFRAPLGFVFRWCTDYQAIDGQLEGEGYERRVLSRSRRKVVYEDLEPTPDGWFWARHNVTLSPPNRWHSVSVGNYRDYELDYELRALPDGRTELLFTGRREVSLLGRKNPSPREFGRSMDRGWRRFRRQLEKDYRATSRGRPRP